jgi:ParB-like chromosome segregation protein Spo0J
MKGAGMSSTRTTFDDGQRDTHRDPQAGELAALEAAVMENRKRPRLNLIEEARACATLVKERNLTFQQVGKRVGRCGSGVANIVRLLNLPAEILEFIERGELSGGHGRALLKARNPKARWELACRAAMEGWSVLTLDARVRASNNSVSDTHGDVTAPQGPVDEKQRDLDAGVHTVARVWGDVLGAEVQVRAKTYGRVRLEVQFSSAEAAIAAGEKLDAAVSRGLGERNSA